MSNVPWSAGGSAAQAHLRRWDREGGQPGKGPRLRGQKARARGYRLRRPHRHGLRSGQKRSQSSACGSLLTASPRDPTPRGHPPCLPDDNSLRSPGHTDPPHPCPPPRPASEFRMLGAHAWTHSAPHLCTLSACALTPTLPRGDPTGSLWLRWPPWALGPQPWHPGPTRQGQVTERGLIWLEPHSPSGTVPGSLASPGRSACSEVRLAPARGPPACRPPCQGLESQSGAQGSEGAAAE